MDPIIIHVDMDAFYAAVETRDDPSLQGKALIIGSTMNDLLIHSMNIATQLIGISIMIKLYYTIYTTHNNAIPYYLDSS